MAYDDTHHLSSKKFDEYISGALASIKHADFIAKGKGNDMVITEGESSPYLHHTLELCAPTYSVTQVVKITQFRTITPYGYLNFGGPTRTRYGSV